MAVTWGWLLVGVFCVLVAMAIGEIASAMPTAGALYFWASKLGRAGLGLVHRLVQSGGPDRGHRGHRLRRCGLYNRVAQPLVARLFGTDPATIFIVYSVIIALHLALNLLNVNLLAKLNTFSAWWHMAACHDRRVLVVVPRSHQSAAFVFSEMIDNSGFGDTGSGSCSGSGC